MQWYCLRQALLFLSFEILLYGLATGFVKESFGKVDQPLRSTVIWFFKYPFSPYRRRLSQAIGNLWVVDPHTERWTVPDPASWFWFFNFCEVCCVLSGGSLILLSAGIVAFFLPTLHKPLYNSFVSRLSHKLFHIYNHLGIPCPCHPFEPHSEDLVLLTSLVKESVILALTHTRRRGRARSVPWTNRWAKRAKWTWRILWCLIIQIRHFDEQAFKASKLQASSFQGSSFIYYFIFSPSGIGMKPNRHEGNREEIKGKFPLLTPLPL